MLFTLYLPSDTLTTLKGTEQLHSAARAWTWGNRSVKCIGKGPQTRNSQGDLMTDYLSVDEIKVLKLCRGG